MKNFITILSFVLLSVGVFAQSPEKMSYQAVIHNSSNQLVANHAVGLRITIIQGSVSGTSIYTETQTPNTNSNGLISIEIGGGVGFNAINWANGPYFIKTETDPTGGTNYTISGTSQLLSVPYALHSKTAESISGGIPNATTFTSGLMSGLDKTKLDGLTNSDGSETKLTAGNNISITGVGTTANPYIVNASNGSAYIGQDKDGGIVFYIYIGSDGQQHGLIVSKTESSGAWQNATVLVNANRSWDGAYNTNLMSNSPAKTWVTSLGAGWYLPSIDELIILWHNRFHINRALQNGGYTLLSSSWSYWSSTEVDASSAYFINFSYGSPNISPNKLSAISYRAIRSF
jgi:hypothetical protein